MAGNAIGKAYVEIGLDPAPLKQQLGALPSDVGGGFGGALGKIGKLGGVALAGGVATGAVVVVKQLLDIGQSFEKLSFDIRAATGKSGDALKGLVNATKLVAESVPATFEDSGNAVSFLSSRLHLTGVPLREMARTILEMSRVTKTDLNVTLEATSQLLGRWQLTGRGATRGLNELFRASQQTQVPIDQLAGLMTKFEPQLKAFGFGFAGSAALLGSFESAGLNTQKMMAGFSTAIKGFAKDGVAPAVGLDLTVRALKRARTETEANGIAIAAFGSRAGPELAAAIRDGRLSIDDLTAKIKQSGEGARKAGKDTTGFSEEWLKFKNKVVDVLAPVATAMFAALGRGMKYVNENAGPLITRLRDELGPTFDNIGRILTALHPVFVAVFAAIKDSISTFLQVVKGIAIVIEGVVAIVTGLLTGDWSKAWDGAKQVVMGLVTIVKAVLDSLVVKLQLALGLVGSAARAIGNAILDGIKSGLSALGGVVTGLVGKGVDAVTGLAGAFAAAARNIATSVLTGIRSGLAALAGVVTGAVHAGVNAVAGMVGAFAGAAHRLADAIVRGVLALGRLPGQLTAKLGEAIRSAAGAAVGLAASIGSAVIQGILNGLGGLAGAVRDKITSALRGAVSLAGSILHGSGDYQFTNEAIGVPMAAGAILGLTTGLNRMGAALAESIRKAVEEGKLEVEASRGKLAEAWGGLSGSLLTAFDAAWATPTAAEAKIAALQAAASAATLQANIDAAKWGLAIARTGGDPATIVAAQKTLDDAVAAQALVALQAKATEERKQRDAEVALKRSHFEDDLAKLQERLASEGATREQANREILRLMRKYHVDYRSAGNELGDAFVTGLKESLDRALAAAAKVAQEIRDLLASASASGGTKKKPPPKGLGFVGSVVAPVVAAGLGPLGALGAGAGAAPAVSLLTGGSSPSYLASLTTAGAGAPATPAAGAPVVAVRVFIGDRELTDLVRTEVRVEQAGVARHLLAAGVA